MFFILHETNPETLCMTHVYRSEEVRGQVPGTKCNGACSKSANIQTQGDVGRPREWRSASDYRGIKPKSRPHSTAPVAGATYAFYYLLSRYNQFNQLINIVIY